MESKHTPGPWICQPIGDETECNILGAGRELIATVADYDGPLIAAAPNLLEVLNSAGRELITMGNKNDELLKAAKDALLTLDFWASMGVNVDDTWNARKSLRVAIAKAEGIR